MDRNRRRVMDLTYDKVFAQLGPSIGQDQVKGWSTYPQTFISPTEIDFVFQH